MTGSIGPSAPDKITWPWRRPWPRAGFRTSFGIFWGYENGSSQIAPTTKRKTSLTLDAEVLDGAKALKVNVSAVAEAVLKNEEAYARYAKQPQLTDKPRVQLLCRAAYCGRWVSKNEKCAQGRIF